MESKQCPPKDIPPLPDIWRLSSSVIGLLSPVSELLSDPDRPCQDKDCHRMLYKTRMMIKSISSAAPLCEVQTMNSSQRYNVKNKEALINRLLCSEQSRYDKSMVAVYYLPFA